MSKIFDALRKAEGATDKAESPEQPAASVHSRQDVEPERARPAQIDINPSNLDLPLEFARELGTLRGSLDQLLPGRTQRTLMVCGALEAEGASTVAVALSRLLAEDEGVRVALVDADLRGVRRRLPTLPSEQGFAGVLGDQIPVAEALVGTTLENLVVLPGSVAEESPLRLLTAENFRRSLEYLKKHFHYVIIDSAPILEAPEAAGVINQTDGVILVVRAARTKREVVQRAIETVEKLQGRVLGAVLNRRQYVIPEFIYRRI